MVGSHLVGWGTMVGKLYLQHGAAVWKLLYGGLAVDVASNLGDMTEEQRRLYIR